MAKPVVGYIGLGTMGLPMAGNLVKAGYTVHGFDVTEAARQGAVQRGIRIQDSPEAVGKACDIVLMCLPTPDSVEQTLDALCRSMAAGNVIVDHSTISPELEKTLCAQAAKSDLAYLDAPLSGAGVGAEEATLSIMVGGDDAAFERCKPLFEVMGANVFHLGQIGNGQCLKLCQNLNLLATLSGVMESIVLGRAVGVEPQQLLAVMDTCIAPSRVMEVLVKPKFDGRVPFDHTTEGMKMITKDITLVRELAESLDLHLPVMERVQDLYSQAVAKGKGKHDLLGWYQLVEEKLFE